MKELQDDITRLLAYANLYVKIVRGSEPEGYQRAFDNVHNHANNLSRSMGIISAAEKWHKAAGVLREEEEQLSDSQDDADRSYLWYLGQEEATSREQLWYTVDGATEDVKKVVAAVRRYFPHAEITVDYTPNDLARPVTVYVEPTTESMDDARQRLKRFDDEWWFGQDIELHERIGVHLR